MSLRIGIPRALLAYYYLPLWESFFTCLGAEVVISPPTNKEILETGVELSVDEACLPVKVFMGHVNYLQSRVDVLFLPRIVSVEPGKYTCPKLLGLPDMVKNSFRSLPAVWEDTINLSTSKSSFVLHVYRIGRMLSPHLSRIVHAYWSARRQMRTYDGLLRQGYTAEEAYARLNGAGTDERNGEKEIKIAVVGHAYNIYDRFICMDVIPRLREMGVDVITPEMVGRADINKATQHMPKDLFWTFCKRIMGTACHYMHAPHAIDGIINVAAFGCGPDSLVGELLEREARRRGHLPFMLLTIDEHTGEAGLVTRLEAFIDMIRRKRRQEHAGNLSPDGNATFNT